MTQSANSILTALDHIAEDAPEDGVTLQALFHRLDERAFGALLFALAVPCCIPFLYLVPQIVALPMAALAAQMAFGREEPWLPGRFADRRIDKQGLTRVATGGRKYFGWAERIARPRLLFLSTRTAERLVGVMLSLFCLSILVPLPGTNTVPGFGVALAAFGLMARDGLLVLLGLIIGTGWIAMLATIGTAGLKAILGL